MSTAMTNKHTNTVGLPDVNAETYPFDLVQKYLDRAAFLNMFAVPDGNHTKRVNSSEPSDWFHINGGYGLDLKCTLHRFDSWFNHQFSIQQTIGEPIGCLRTKLLFGPQSTEWSPSAEPSPRIFDKWRPRRFVSSLLQLSFGADAHQLRGYMMGNTYPVSIDGRPQVVVCAIGNLSEGAGNLTGLEGTICLQGSLTESLEFQGNVTCRIVDPDQLLIDVQGSIQPLIRLPNRQEPAIFQADGATYIVMRGEKANRHVRTEYGDSPGPGLVSLVTPAEMKAVRFPLQATPEQRLRTGIEVGPVVARLKATVGLDILASPGTFEAPNNFNTTNIYSFLDDGGQTIGAITASVETGKSFNLQFPDAPGQPGMRYGGFGPILSGTGAFEGVAGTLIVNSAIGVAPHALSMLNVLRIIDPNGEFRECVLGNAPDTNKRLRISVVVPEPMPTGGTGNASRTYDHSTPLPDINQETYPFEQVEQWLDEATILNLYALPKYTACKGIRDAQGFVVGFMMEAILHRFDVDPSQEGVLKATEIGEPVATLSQRCLLMPDGHYALPGRQPPPTRLDRNQSQRFVILKSEITVRDSRHGIAMFGTGRTYPTPVVNGRTELQLAAIAEVIDGQGQFRETVGTCTFCGVLNEGMQYLGSVLIRCVTLGRCAIIPEANSRKPARSVKDIEPGVTYLVYRGQKPTPDSRTEYTFDASGEVEGLALQQELRSLRLNVKLNGRITAGFLPGKSIGRMTANVLFNILDPGAPGTSLSPIPFKSINRFFFSSLDGTSNGNFEVTGGEGRTFNFTFPQAPQQRGLRFAAFGPISNGAGIFSNSAGLMIDNSVVGVAPHATSTLYVVRLRKAKITSARLHTIEDGHYETLVSNVRDSAKTHLAWRNGFQAFSDRFSEALAASFNVHRDVGEFSTISLDAGSVRDAFNNRIQTSFDTATFDKFDGPAKALFRTYSIASGRELGSSTLFSYWLRSKQENSWQVQRITGSSFRYYDPRELPDLTEGRVDLLVNTYREDVGIVGWVSHYQGGRQESSNIAYEIQSQGVHQVLWISKIMSKKGVRVDDNVFRVSLEWKGTHEDRVCYFMVAMFFDIDLDQGGFAPHGDTFWKARYEEESSGMPNIHQNSSRR